MLSNIFFVFVLEYTSISHYLCACEILSLFYTIYKMLQLNIEWAALIYRYNAYLVIRYVR